MTVAQVGKAPTLWLRASPFGKRSGFVGIPIGDDRFSLAVLPKAWSEVGPRRHVVRLDRGQSRHLTVHELDWIRLDGPPSLLGSLALSLGQLSGSGEEALVVPCAEPTPLPQQGASSWSDLEGFNALLDLLLLAERGGLRMLAEAFGQLASASWLRVLTHIRFLDTLSRLMSYARPEYDERSEVLVSPRGRLKDTSVFYAAHTGEPLIECVHDEHSMDTPLLRCMLAAVHVVAAIPTPAPLSAVVGGLPRRAGYLARNLASVALLPRREALRLASHLRLSRLQLHWEPALALARQVLADTTVPPLSGQAVTQAVAFHVLTDKFWEQVVRESLFGMSHGLRVASNNRTPAGLQSLIPWARTDRSAPPDTHPDFVFRYGHEVVVADAKYKLPDDSLSAADGYQMFAYSHLTRLEGALATTCLVVFPRSPEGSAHHSLLVRGPNGDMPLILLGLPFPSRGVLRSSQSWQNYLTVSSRQLVDGLADLDEVFQIESRLGST